MILGDTFYHWRFGPVEIKEIEDSFILIEVKDPSGLRNTIYEKIPLKIDKKHIGKFFFSDAQQISFDVLFDFAKLHGKMIPYWEQRILRTINGNQDGSQIQKTFFFREYKDNNRKLNLIGYLIPTIKKIILTYEAIIKNISLDLDCIETEITEIEQIQSPRELKNAYLKTPNLNVRKKSLMEKQNCVIQSIKFFQKYFNKYNKLQKKIQDEIMASSKDLTSMTKQLFHNNKSAHTN